MAFCDEQPEERVMNMFQKRRDNQIMGLELLSIALGNITRRVRLIASALLAFLFRGISTFKEWVRGRDVVIFSDNAGAEHATRKGANT